MNQQVKVRGGGGQKWGLSNLSSGELIWFDLGTSNFWPTMLLLLMITTTDTGESKLSPSLQNYISGKLSYITACWVPGEDFFLFFQAFPEALWGFTTFPVCCYSFIAIIIAAPCFYLISSDVPHVGFYTWNFNCFNVLFLVHVLQFNIVFFKITCLMEFIPPREFLSLTGI